MQDEVNEKTIALCVQCGRMTAGVLKAAMRKYLNGAERHKQKKVQRRQAVKNGRAQERSRAKERRKLEKKQPHGKQTIKQLMAKGAQLTNILITDDNIKSFDRVARKYGIDYSLKKVKGEKPPRYLVFFKGRDVDVMTEAFKEFAAKKLNREKKPSIRKALAAFKEKAKQVNQNREKVKNKDRGREL